LCKFVCFIGWSLLLCSGCVRRVQHIKEQMSNMGWTVSEDSFTDTTPLDDKTFVNVIAVHDPAVTRRLTLACHYDSKFFTDIEFIGATDSAVPCALMIDIARVLNASLSKVPHTCLTFVIAWVWVVRI